MLVRFQYKDFYIRCYTESPVYTVETALGRYLCYILRMKYW